MLKSYVAGLGLVFVGVLAGCGSAEDADELNQAEDDLSANGNDGFWRVVGVDYRKCSFPMCGGVYVSKVNGALTRCADGSVADKCYVAQIKLDGLELPEAQATDLLAQAKAGNVILRAQKLVVGTVDMPNADSVSTPRGPVLNATEGWLRLAPTEDSSIDGVVYRATDSGIRCITTPCPSLNAAKINGRKKANVTGIDLSTVSPAPSQEELDAAWQDLAEGGFLFASTDVGSERDATAVFTRVTPREDAVRYCGGRGMGTCEEGESCIYTLANACGSFDAPGQCTDTRAMLCPQIYAPVCGCDGQTYSNECMAHVAGTSAMRTGECDPVVEPEPEPEPCFVGGCSGQVCSGRKGVITTCDWRAEYACYRTATCERQESGQCGWTPTDALTSCIENSK